MLKRFVAALGIASLMLVGFSGIASATPGFGGDAPSEVVLTPQDKIDVCHATGNGEYELIRPSVRSHLGNNGHSTHEDDIYLEFWFKQNKKSDMVLVPGKNTHLWETYANGCVDPNPDPDPDPDPLLPADIDYGWELLCYEPDGTFDLFAIFYELGGDTGYEVSLTILDKTATAFVEPGGYRIFWFGDIEPGMEVFFTVDGERVDVDTSTDTNGECGLPDSPDTPEAPETPETPDEPEAPTDEEVVTEVIVTNPPVDTDRAVETTRDDSERVVAATPVADVDELPNTGTNVPLTAGFGLALLGAGVYALRRRTA